MYGNPPLRKVPDHNPINTFITLMALIVNSKKRKYTTSPQNRCVAVSVASATPQTRPREPWSSPGHHQLSWPRVYWACEFLSLYIHTKKNKNPTAPSAALKCIHICVKCPCCPCSCLDGNSAITVLNLQRCKPN